MPEILLFFIISPSVSLRLTPPSSEGGEGKPDYDRGFVNKAATGWQNFKIDEINRKYYGTDSGFHRWKDASGDPDLDDDFYKPAKNWSADANNTFGYLYSQNKEDAYRFAKTLNKAYRQLDESVEGIKEFGQRIWDNHTQAQQRNSEAQTASADMIGEGWDRVKDVGQKAWNHHAENAREHSRQSVQAGKSQADAALRAGNAGFQGAGNLAVQQAESQKKLADQVGKPIAKYYTDFQSNPDAGKILAQSTKVTGSDQTGASIFGFQNDTRYKEPSDEWTDGERRLYEYHLKTNPEEAEAYAIRTNDRHNQKKKDQKIQNVEDWTSQSGVHGAAAWIGARAANVVSGIDGYNQQLELAATGRVAPNPELTATDLVNTVDDTNAKNLSDHYGNAAGIAYRIGTDVTDAMISRGVNHLPVAKISKKSKSLGKLKFPKKDVDIRLHDVNEAIDAFNSGYLGARDNDKSEVISAGADVVVGHISDKISGKFFEDNPVIKSVMEETIASTIDNTVKAGSEKWFERNCSEIERRKKQYMQEKKVSEQTAWWMATKELLQASMK